MIPKYIDLSQLNKGKLKFFVVHANYEDARYEFLRCLYDKLGISYNSFPGNEADFLEMIKTHGTKCFTYSPFSIAPMFFDWEGDIYSYYLVMEE